MLKRPQWVKEKINGRDKEVPLQMTVKKKYSTGTPYVNLPTMGMTTGNGVDGVTQTGKMVDVQVHEGEGIIPNNAMQGLTGEEFQGLVETLSSGSINKNKFREAINMPTVAEYQTGGRALDYTTDPNAAAVFPNVDYVNSSNNTRTVDPANTTEPTVSTLPAISPVMRDTATTGIQIQAPTTTPQSIQTEEVKAPQTPTVEFKPPPPIQQQTIAAPATPEQPAVPEVKVPTAQETVAQPVVSSAGEAVRIGLQNILAEAQGVSDVDRKIANFYLQNIDASNAANLRVLESQISADPEMSEQGKQAAIRGLQREAAAIRAQEVGKMSIDAAQRASTASRDLVTYGGQVRTYEEVTLPAARQNLEIARRTFDEITLPKSQLEIEKMKSDLGSQNWDEIQEMINKGMTIERVNEKLAEKGISPLSTSEYADMLQAGSLGERNWNRQLAAANMLLTTPGETNKEAAAQMYSNLYEGVDFDFSTLISQENAEIFSQGLSQMASYVAAGWDTDTALEAMKKDETFAMLGMDEGQIAQMYNATKVNALDAEWEEIESSQMYQNLLNSTDPEDQAQAAAIKQFNVMSKMGMLDYDTLHEYKITGPDGVAKGSIYAKTPEDAQEQANSYGAGYTIEDTGNVDFAIKEEPTTEVETDLTNKWDTFKESIPADVPIDQDLYKRWQTWQENNTGNYEEFLKTESPLSRLQALDITKGEEMLETDNSKVMWDAFEKDPEAFKNSEFYFQYPEKQYLRENITTTRKAGKNVTDSSNELKALFNEADGKMVELPDGTVGQVVATDDYDSPSTVQLTVRLKNGKETKFVVYNRDTGVNYAGT